MREVLGTNVKADSPARSPVKALLLDLDGTVADTHELIFRCFCDTLAKHLGCHAIRSVWERSLGLPLEEFFQATLRHLGRCDLSPELLVSSYRARLAEIDGSVVAFPGMAETLRALRRRGIRLAIVTSKHDPAASRHLRSLKLADLFDCVITGDQCARCKPDPEPFARALAALGVPASEAAGVGDTAYDLQSARAAGALAVAACWGTCDRSGLLSAGPDLVLEQTRDLLRLVE
jgi:HAD superfamily hydrolase (TIGR01509 family)